MEYGRSGHGKTSKECEIIMMEGIVKDAMQSGAIGFQPQLLRDTMEVEVDPCHLD